jgi:peptide deformylase
MAILKIRTYPDEVLKKKAEPVKEIDSDVQKLIADMIETMHSSSGIGLAATQVGVSKRIIVIDLSSVEKDSSPIVIINPEIVESDSLIDSEEGCLSIPGYRSVIKRAGRVVVRGLDKEGKEIKVEGTGLLARALQHEIDHLDGILFVDRMGAIKKELFKKRYAKAISLKSSK